MDDNVRAFPEPTLRRLPAYHRFLKILAARGRPVVSCTHIATELGLDPTQVRKDIQVTGIVGKPRVGYLVPELIDAIETFLGWKNSTDAFLVGVGHLGTALLGYGGFREYGLNIVAAFDKSPEKIGTQVHGREVQSVDSMAELAQRMHILIGILTVPADSAQDLADLLVFGGIRAVWNFTPVKLHLPPAIIVENVQLSASLAVLSNKLAESLKADVPQEG
ncbi:MAG TPA: redox-sensing transcriptional repressor Rex [Phycisphaerae bacterium]|nr:redox-sensing transcriptional repressor Rex [Phycisphaerae bacterium]HOI56396.1 redox-sensing transcriptional repressor Rex [Phycisphaerae bacterium]